MENILTVSPKVKSVLTISPTFRFSCDPKSLPKKNENSGSHKDLHTNVHSNSVHYSQNLKVIQVSINSTSTHLTTISKKKVQPTIIYNMDGSQKHYTEQKKLAEKEYILYESISGKL